MGDPLTTYLNDHLAGAGVAIDLLRAMKDRHDDKSLSQFAKTILTGVEEDEDTLQSIAKDIGSELNAFKQEQA